MTQSQIIHQVLQGKGGVGKSLVASIIAQHAVSRGQDVKCYDTDPVNATFARYEAFSAHVIPLIDDEQQIKSREFDDLAERLIAHRGTSVVDNGASTFLPWCSYSVQNSLEEMLLAADKQVFIHTVVTGGQAAQDTIDGLQALIQANAGAKIVVWANEFFGPVTPDGRSIHQHPLVVDNMGSIVAGVVSIKARNPETFGKDVQEMVQAHLTFDQVQFADGFGLMPRTRLETIRRDLFGQLDCIY